MITKIRIASFRCIRELEMDLEPLTVLVGPNASGKSTVLTALSMGAPDRLTANWGTSAPNITWYADDVVVGRVEDGDLAKQPPRVGLYHLDLAAMRRPNPFEDTPGLERDGSNLANAFATLTRRKQAEVAQRLEQLVDVFRDVDVRPLERGLGHILFQDRWNDRWFTTNEVSDGTLLVLAFLVLQHQERRPDVICLEEPERGLHPYLLGQIIDLLRDISEGKHGPPTQFVLATQSAELLDHVRPHEVRFLERDADGGVQVRTAPTKDEAWVDAIREYEHSVGQMWLSGSLGGVPGTT